jgi:hypothetical protein
MAFPKFTKTVIGVINNDVGSPAMNTSLSVGDINSNGALDVVVSGWNGRMVWLENRSQDPWLEHVIDDAVKDVECGSILRDITGNGRLDIMNGSARGGEVWWWENPRADQALWTKRSILKTGVGFFHDTAIGDATNNGRLALLTTNQDPDQATAAVYWIPLPTDPTVSPWPEAQIIAEGLTEPLEAPDGQIIKNKAEEGLAVGDIDGDGLNEVIAGTHWFKYVDGQWEGHKFASGYITNKVAIGDVDGDGKNEIVLAEGDPVIYGKTQGGRVGWFKPGPDITAQWQEHTLDDGLLDAHTLKLADINRNGKLDILVGEIGIASATRGYRRREPWNLLYENLGGGQFARHIIDQGTGNHEGVLADLNGNGLLDLVSKPLHGPDRWNIIVFFQEAE